MKSKLLALTLCLAAVSFAKAEAQTVKQKSLPSLKDAKSGNIPKGLPYFKASAVFPVTFNGSATAPFTALTFDLHEHIHGRGIQPKNHHQYILEPGSYQVSFTGTFSTMTNTIINIELGLKLNSTVINTQITNADLGFMGASQVITYTKTIQVKKATVLEVVARNPSDLLGSMSMVVGRNLSIIKID